MELLLFHDTNVSASGGTRETDSLFASLSRYRPKSGPTLTFRLLDIRKCIPAFCDHFSIPRFSSTQLRDQIANRDYLRSGKNPYRVKALLGHAQLAATAGYLNTHIQRVLHEANINRFMKRLAASTLFVTNRTGQLTSHGLGEEDIDKAMLFPASHFEGKTTNALADRWLSGATDTSIRIGIAELQHCALQRRFYQDAMPLLKQANPDRFRLHHLPRILFCIALYRLIEASPYRSVLRDFEGVLNEDA